jgi:hypothetical protein
LHIVKFSAKVWLWGLLAFCIKNTKKESAAAKMLNYFLFFYGEKNYKKPQQKSVTKRAKQHFLFVLKILI